MDVCWRCMGVGGVWVWMCAGGVWVLEVCGCGCVVVGSVDVGSVCVLWSVHLHYVVFNFGCVCVPKSVLMADADHNPDEEESRE